MGISDRLKDLKTKAVDATVERSQNASAKAGSLVDGLKSSDLQAGAQSEEEASVDTQAAPTAGPESAPPAAGADAPPTP
jgi:hypothetical protein